MSIKKPNKKNKTPLTFNKIADFGFAAPIEGRDGSGFLNTVLGT